MAVYHTSTGGSSPWTDAAQVGPLTEGAGGIAVIVLTVLGLAAVSPAVLASVATIIIGAALIIEAANTAVEYSRVTTQVPGETSTQVQRSELGADVTIELMAGVAGIILGVLALLSVGSLLALLPAALVVFGGCMLLSGISATTVGAAQSQMGGAGQVVTMETELAPARGMQVLVGITAVVLGILSFVVVAAGTTLMVGLLVVGAGLLGTSANFTQSFVRLMQR